MKRTMSFLAAMLLAAAGFAQASWTLSPASGTNFYSDDAAYNGKISATYSDAIVTTDAKVEITTSTGTVDITAASITNNGAFIDPAGQLTADDIDKPFTVKITGVKDANGIAVPDLTGTYTYRGDIPVGAITPAKGSTLASKTETVTIAFTKDITCTSIVITSGTKVTNLPGIAVANKNVAVSLTADYWGTPTAGYNHITIALKGVKDPDGTEFSDTPGTPGTITTYYTVADATSTVTYLGVDPEPDWTYANDLMGWEVIFKFSDTVVMTNENATAVIKYYDAFETLLGNPINVAKADIFAGKNPREGYYGLFVTIDSIAVELLPDLAYMTIDLQGITYNGVAVTLPTPPLVTYEAAPITFRAPATRGEHGGGTTGIEVEKINQNPIVNIYSAQGILLKKNVPESTVNSLGKGLYIVGGKKVLVK